VLSANQGEGVQEVHAITLESLQRALAGDLWILQSAKGKRALSEFVAHRSRI